MDSIFWLFLYQIIMDFDICFLTVIIICINYHEWLVKNCLCSKDCLPCSPWFCTVCRFLKSFWKIIQGLECVCNFCNFLDPLTDHAAEFFFQVLADDKYNFIKTSFQCIMNGVIHNDLTIWSYWCKLFDSFSKATSDSGCHDYKCSFFHLKFLPLFFFI